jgi:hypothetical protein
MGALEIYGKQLARFLYFGVPIYDLKALAGINSISEWAQALARRGEAYERLAEEHEKRSHRQSAAALFYTAASCFHYAQINLSWSEAKERLRSNCRRAFLRMIPLLEDRIDEVTISFQETRLPGYVSPRIDAPTVVLINGLDSAKEIELFRFALGFLDRGLSIACFDVPGLGELSGVGTLESFDEAVACIRDWLRGEGRLDSGMECAPEAGQD